jgi:hypothetical protein
MAKPKSTIRKGVRMTGAGPKVVTTKRGKGLTDKILKAFGK